jgi:hypothetical protein
MFFCRVIIDRIKEVLIAERFEESFQKVIAETGTVDKKGKKMARQRARVAHYI